MFQAFRTWMHACNNLPKSPAHPPRLETASRQGCSQMGELVGCAPPRGPVPLGEGRRRWGMGGGEPQRPSAPCLGSHDHTLYKEQAKVPRGSLLQGTHACCGFHRPDAAATGKEGSVPLSRRYAVGRSGGNENLGLVPPPHSHQEVWTQAWSVSAPLWPYGDLPVKDGPPNCLPHPV